MNKRRIIALTLGLSIIMQPVLGNKVSAHNVNGTSILKNGTRNSIVRDVQNRLKELGYFNVKPTGYFGNITESSVKRFQKDNGSIVDGIVGPITLKKMNIQKIAKKSNNIVTSNSKNKIKSIARGSKGKSVSQIQNKLKDMGYFNANITGYFGRITESSVKKFQKNNKLKVDGIVGKNTLNKLKASNSKAYVPSRGTTNIGKSDLTWFGYITKVIPRGTVYKIFDIDTGKEFNVKRTYGTNHADSETLTKKDTEIMKSIYGGTWSWKRRAIIVEVNGMKFSGSMAGMPHGSDFIGGNNMKGHFDVHFLLSKTHGTNRVDPNHQKAVKKAKSYLEKQ
ncbi:hypothetical protein SH2C18_13810 [Clostridium sediminicola]|uniref:peptidoglycan-binding domain-containing protein n=1 Tax=Clostridium sediminicola TaxID=3114879 RepID=UPI0031F2377B